MENSKKLLSLVIPCYNESEVIAELAGRLTSFSDELDEEIDVEVIFVDDGSSDNTRDLLRSVCRENSRFRIIGFSRNFGHQMAVTAGIDVAVGDAVVVIDADLQDPLEEVHQMVAKWQEGFDVVYGKRSDRQGETLFKRATAYGFYRLLNTLSDVPIPLDTGDFRLMSRAVVNVLISMPERDRFIRGMVSWSGFRQTALSYRRSERFAGKSKYPLRKMLLFAIDGILSFSTKPLQISIGFGVVVSLISLLGIMYALFMRLFTANYVQGWTLLMIAVLFIGGVQLISVGILGEYIGRIYNEVKRRPLYVVDEYFGFGAHNPMIGFSTAKSRS